VPSINDVIYIGTKENGLLTTTIATVSVFENTTLWTFKKNNILPFKQHQVPCGQFMVTMMLINPYDLDMVSVNTVSPMVKYSLINQERNQFVE
jgi:hypothetical protein